MNSHEINTLLELLTAYTVEVPIVQRDYAQGRNDADTKIIRSNLLADMKAAILGETAPLDLSFVYGKLDGNKFIPIDGQQRLTTLFLLHLYAFADDDSKTHILKKFTYETRNSSRNFLEQITEHRKAIFESPLKPSEEIIDSEWFAVNWQNDPTVQSALTMLDDIKLRFDDVDNLAQKLSNTEDKVVTFKFLEMKELGMEDSLYIKLNSRGKPLTSFENFKARLNGRLKELKSSLLLDFEKRLDSEWTELFWSKRKLQFDQTFIAFFGEILSNKGYDTSAAHWERGFAYEKLDLADYETMYYSLNYLCTLPPESNVLTSVFKTLSQTRNYQDRTIFFAITTYLYNSKGKDTGTFRQWLRIFENLTYNSTIDKIDLYNRAIGGIDKVSEHFNDVLAYFSKGGSVIGFAQEQIKEEQEKAKIIINDPSFAQKLYEAEGHKYFRGQIRAALYLSKDANGFYVQADFVKYWTVISKLFTESGSKYGHLLRRALLTYGDYTLPVGAYKTFGVDDPNEAQNTPSLKKLFSGGDVIIKSLLDQLATSQDVKAELETIVSKSNVPENDWRYCFITTPKLFDKMSVSHLRLRDVNGEMVIVPNKSTNGYSYGVYLACLKEHIITKYPNVPDQNELGTYADRYLALNSYIIRFDKGKFTVKDQNGAKIYTSSSSKPITEIMGANII
jgi:hypothetical protein